MKSIILLSFILIFSTIGVFAQSKPEPAVSTKIEISAQNFPDGFKTDNCSLFFDLDYADCCVAHDLEYFEGGSWKERWRADSRLRKCVSAKKGWWHKPLSLAIWSGVRVGGVPFLPTSFRWGFGKKKKSQVLSPKSQVEEKVQTDSPKPKINQ